MKEAKIINKKEYLQLLGAFTLSKSKAKEYQRISEYVQEVFAEILQFEGDDKYNKGGWIASDNDFEEESDLKQILKEHNITIK